METRREIEEELTHHFFDILSEDGGDRGRAIAKITRLILRIVSKENNEIIINPISMQEVEEVTHQMALGKASGPDGLT